MLAIGAALNVAGLRAYQKNLGALGFNQTD